MSMNAKLQRLEKIEQQYQQLCEDYGMQSQALAEYDKTIQRLMKENEGYREALKYYANQCPEQVGPDQWEPMCPNMHSVAEKALKTVKEK